MKQQFLYVLVCFAGSIFFSSCESYLSHYMGDQMTIEEVFSKKETTEQYLAKVYSYLPNEIRAVWEAMTGCSDEAYYSWTTGQMFQNQNNGSWSPALPDYHQWSHYYEAINQATVFIDHVDECRDEKVSDMRRAEMKAEARFLRAYYYFLLFRQYGPIYIWGDQAADINIRPEEIDRHTVDYCVDFIAGEFDKAAEDLSLTVNESAWGARVTKGTALAAKSRLLLYAARPLYNGCEFYKGMTNQWGEKMFPQAKEDAKWRKAADAAKAVIDLGVYELYQDLAETDPLQRGIKSYQGIYFKKWNKELIWARYYDGEVWNARCLPSGILEGGIAGYGPSMKLVDTYPMQESGRFPVSGYLADGTPVVDPQSGYIADGFTDNWIHPIEKTDISVKDREVPLPIKVHNSCVGRDARFYASILFNGAYWQTPYNGAKLVTFYKGGTSSYGQASGDFNKVGFLFRRMTDPANNYVANEWGNFSWPYIRLGEVYLNYAEACNEMSPRNEKEALLYINKIRNRSGLKKLEIAYPEVIGNQELFRKLLQKERAVEMAFENLRYWDERTWMIAATECNGPRYGLNLTATNYEDSWKRTDKNFTPLVFEMKHSLFPIYQGQLDEMRNITQNTGW
ncbi:RagB/SusD family nutrient uptake outer membrane protein [Parabacteroides pacaensis]|uniref:RagB/SusD family nutrient uptake outer membrane protein n=1 Tax=Parabacteroides pacaensis TaxID=2086575 RepID=UPI000D0F5D1E|nr:RagB/SusD family nutrient uptake outer membrane protein [Parabacteroides pacaensis]